MENTEQNAQEFYLNNISHIDGEPTVFGFAQLLVAYAEEVNPETNLSDLKAVLEDAISKLPKPEIKLPSEEKTKHISAQYKVGWNECIKEIKTLNGIKQ